MKIIVGLGNPGEKYNNTRHNIGFNVLDFLVEKNNLKWQENKKFNVFLARNQDTFFVKPMTFMNNSGKAVQAVMLYYNLLEKSFGMIKKGIDLSDNLTVIHDDLDIEFGKIKTSINSSSAGHNGVQSIIDYLKTKNFKRIRVGIKKENNQIPIEKFVLQRFNKEEMEVVNNLILNNFNNIN